MGVGASARTVTAARRPHVVIVGGGFGGMAAARALRKAPVDVTLVDRSNHHVFAPLLYQVATAALAPSDIAVPIRWMLRGQRNATVLLGNVASVDRERRAVTLEDGQVLSAEYLVVAAGTRHSYFGHDEWEPLAHGLKTLEDALVIRNRFLLAFERAESSASAEERAACQTIVIVGGGPTGVELAGIMISIARHTLHTDFRRIDPRRTRVVLVEAGPRLLPAFRERLSRRARRDLEALGVEVRVGTPVSRIEADAVQVGAERIAARTVFWAAGNRASRLSTALAAPLDRARRVQVEPDLSVPGLPNVFVVGDQAVVMREDGTPVPGVAQGALQMGRAAALNILCDLRGRPRRPFHYRNRGDLAVIGRYRAVAQFPGGIAVSGFIAWFLWLFIHIMYLAGFRNRLSVLLEWAYAYFTWQRGVRLVLRERALMDGDA